METYTLYLPGRAPRRRSSIPLIAAALAMAGAFGPPAHSFEPFRARRFEDETEDERYTRWAREDAKRERDSAEAIAAARSRREKREARRQADRERTARQQGRTLQANNRDDRRRAPDSAQPNGA